ncbi:MAG: hypothetical protein L6R42_010403, partial [Xanthoria sp. 1 TBL-2021]
MKKPPGEDERITIFSETGLTSTQAAADACRSVFEALEEALRKASRQIRRRNVKPGEKIVLSKAESLKWPFLQPNFDALSQELSSSRATLMLILQVTTLAYQKRLAELQRAPTMSRGEQEALISSIIAMQKTEREQLSGESSLSDPKIKGSQEQLLLSIPNDPPAPPSSLANPTRLPEVDPRQAGHPKPIEQHDQDHRAGHPTHSSCRQMLEEPPPPCSQPRTASSNLREISSTEPPSINKASLGDPSNHSIPAIEAGRDLQIWIFVPTVKAVYCGYKMTWLTKQLPVPAYEAQQEIHTRAQKDERTLTEQLASLTLKEREFLDAFVDGQIPGATAHKASGRSGAVRIELLGVIAEGTQVPYNHFEEIKTRDIIVIVRVRRSEPLVQSHAIGLEISLTMSNTQDVYGFDGHKYTKIHSTYISPNVLNIYKYAWEWDKTDPYLILIEPLSQKQINKLVSTQRKIDDGASSAEPGPSGFRFGENILQKTHRWIRN